MRTMVEHVHQQLQGRNVEIAIDFTMGNGYDTLALSKVAKQVYSFDIQKEALENTKQILQDVTNVTLIQDSHAHFDTYIEAFDIGIFNLGYLPNGDHTITTTHQTTLMAIDKALSLLRSKGVLFIVIYVGHQEGYQEAKEIEAYIASMTHKDYNIAKFCMLYKEQAPYVMEIEKR